MSSPDLPGPHCVTLDASFVIGLCAKEPGKYSAAQVLLSQRIGSGCTLHAPHLLVMEAAYVFCGKLNAGTLTASEHAAAVANLHSLAALITFPAGGDAALIHQAERLRQGYGCSRSADSFYIALAEHLALAETSELLTFDAGQQSQAALLAPSVVVTLVTQ